MSNGQRACITIAILFCAAFAAAIYFGRGEQSVADSSLSPFSSVRQAATGQLPVLFESPSFNFVDQNGRLMSEAALAGKVWIADFIFTSCNGSCPRVTAEMVKLQKDIDDPAVRFVTFSVDPARDQPSVLKNYAALHNPNESRWMLLKPPDSKTIVDLAKRMAAVSHASAHDEIVHTDFFILIDPAGKVRGLYDSKDSSAMARLKTDVTSVARDHALATMRPATQPGE